MNHAQDKNLRSVEVLLTKPFDHGFDYAVPEGMAVKPGSLVEVPFGKQTLKGVVLGEGTQKLDPAKIKPLQMVLSHLPALKPSLLSYIDWVSRYTLSPKGQVLKMVLPMEEALEPVQQKPFYMRSSIIPKPVTAARIKVLTLMEDEKPRTALDIHQEAEVSAAVVNGLVEQGALVCVKAPSLPVSAIFHDIPAPTLSDSQAHAAKDIHKKIGGGFSVTLLDGVTGSGKTEVYFDVIEALLKTPAAQSLVLLPEIALSLQWVDRCEARFGFRPVVWHSNLKISERRENFRAIQSGKARLIVGARSALFLPYTDLQLIVVDEEHEISYKQEEGVLYQARDMAVARAFQEKIPVVLASATPSLETVHNVQQGRYSVITLPERHGGVKLPGVHLVDMRHEALESGTWISGRLRAEIAETLSRGKQVMLFLNRRGYAPLLLCRGCGHRFACTECSSWMVLHRSNGKLVCHHCGVTAPVPEQCPACSAKESLVACGPGVERVHEEIRELFPKARVAVMASDTMTNLAEAEKTVGAMTGGDIDILVGTQMMAKGYHFPKLHLIGVIDADLGLSGGDLRAAERTYQMLHQVAGRAGRETDQGVVLLQTYVPDHPVMQALAHHDRKGLEALELDARRDAGFPPFGRLAGVIVEGANEADVVTECRKLARSAPKGENIRVLGPAPAPISRLKGRYRYRFLVKAGKDVSIQRLLSEWLPQEQRNSKIRIRADIDPYSFF